MRKQVTVCLHALLLLALYLSAPAAQQAKIIAGKVVGVAGGDTITVLDATNRHHIIRCQGIDAPESAQAFGQRSKQSLNELVFGKQVTVLFEKLDKYGRVVGPPTPSGRMSRWTRSRRESRSMEGDLYRQPVLPCPQMSSSLRAEHANGRDGEQDYYQSVSL